MKKTITPLAIIALLLVFAVGCKPKIDPVSTRIAKNWKARLVKHGSTVVYSQGGTNQGAPGYANYSLNLSSSPSVTLRDVDGTTFAGSYSVPSDTKLSLTNLSPQPTGSSGTLEYTIQSITEDGSEMVLVSTAYAKTGGTINTLTLTSL